MSHPLFQYMRAHNAVLSEDEKSFRFFCPVCQVDQTVDPGRHRGGMSVLTGATWCLGDCPPGAVLSALAIPAAELAAGRGYPLLSIDDVMESADPEWLIDSIMPSSGLSVLYGQPGTFKSFLALDWALSAAAGVDWLGRQVKQRTVVYIAAEGSAGMRKRIRTWLASHPDADPRARFFLIADAVNLLDPAHVSRAVETLDSVDGGCGLVVVDTMARSMVGGDENSVEDVGRFVDSVELLRRTDAALVVHHSDKSGKDLRGSGSLRGAADLVAKIVREEKSPAFRLRCEKAKDAEEFKELVLHVEHMLGSIYISRHLEGQDRIEMLRSAVVAAVRDNPGISGNQIETRVSGRRVDILEAVKAAEIAGRIYPTGSGWKVVPSAPEPPGNHLSGGTSGGRNLPRAETTTEMGATQPSNPGNASTPGGASQARPSTGSPGAPLKGPPGEPVPDGGPDTLPEVSW